MRTIPRRTTFSLMALALAAALAIPAVAGHCATYGTAQPEADTDPAGLGTPRYYVEFFLCDGSPDCMFSLWVYEETNGIPGLQRGDEEVDNTCHGAIESDTIVF